MLFIPQLSLQYSRETRLTRTKRTKVPGTCAGPRLVSLLVVLERHRPFTTPPTTPRQPAPHLLYTLHHLSCDPPDRTAVRVNTVQSDPVRGIDQDREREVERERDAERRRGGDQEHDDLIKEIVREKVGSIERAGSTICIWAAACVEDPPRIAPVITAGARLSARVQGMPQQDIDLLPGIEMRPMTLIWLTVGSKLEGRVKVSRRDRKSVV